MVKFQVFPVQEDSFTAYQDKNGKVSSVSEFKWGSFWEFQVLNGKVWRVSEFKSTVSEYFRVSTGKF